MERKNASDYPPEVLKLFDGYVHGSITRRDFLDRAAKYAVGTFTAAAMLESLLPNFAWAEQISKDDKRIKIETLSYTPAGGSGSLRGYYARPANANGKVPTVVVIHENRGLNPYIEDVTRRLAVAGYNAFAPDVLTPLGGYPGNEDKARELFGKLDRKKCIEDLMGAVPFIKSRPESTGKVGAVGFCFGGGVTGAMAVRFPDLAGAVSYYGAQPEISDVHKIKAPLLIHYASEDEKITSKWPAYETALKANKIKYQGFVYPKTQHGFHNDTTPRFDESAAKLSWERTLEFFSQNLK